MTVFGGERRDDGTVIGGFLVICANCGWHSTVKWDGNCGRFMHCTKCDNKFLNRSGGFDGPHFSEE